MSLGYRDEQCPARPNGLSHTQDGSIICVHCGQMVLVRQWPDQPAKEEPSYGHRGPLGSDDGAGRGAMTPKQKADMEFLAWLYWRGELD